MTRRPCVPDHLDRYSHHVAGVVPVSGHLRQHHFPPEGTESRRVSSFCASHSRQASRRRSRWRRPEDGERLRPISRRSIPDATPCRVRRCCVGRVGFGAAGYLWTDRGRPGGVGGAGATGNPPVIDEGSGERPEGRRAPIPNWPAVGVYASTRDFVSITASRCSM